MKTKIEKCVIRNRIMLTVAAILFFVGAVFRIADDKILEGVIYFAAAVCFTSLERACSRRANEGKDNHGTTECEGEDNE